jgi:predicted DNA binding protein
MIKEIQGIIVKKPVWLAMILLSQQSMAWSEEVVEPLQDRSTTEVVESPQATVTSEEVEAEAEELLDAQGIEESPVPDAYVARAVFTTAVVNREPVDQVVSLDENATEVSFFTDLRNLQGRTVIHRWEFEGEVISEVNIQVGGPRWRAYSIKSLNPGEEGKWTVFVIDESGWPLHASIFQQRANKLTEN